eukprot:gene14782-biopygen5141
MHPVFNPRPRCCRWGTCALRIHARGRPSAMAKVFMAGGHMHESLGEPCTGSVYRELGPNRLAGGRIPDACTGNQCWLTARAKDAATTFHFRTQIHLYLTVPCKVRRTMVP